MYVYLCVCEREKEREYDKCVGCKRCLRVLRGKLWREREIVGYNNRVVEAVVHTLVREVLFNAYNIIILVPGDAVVHAYAGLRSTDGWTSK